jgi:hypothetical protein
MITSKVVIIFGPIFHKFLDLKNPISTYIKDFFHEKKRPKSPKNLEFKKKKKQNHQNFV